MREKALMDILQVIPDPRIDRCKKHNLTDILVIAICGVMSTLESWTEIEDYGNENYDWFSSFLDLPNGIPSHDTFGRVFSILEPEQIQIAFLEWVKDLKKILPREVVSIDGKALRASVRERGRPRSALSMVSAWATEAGIVLGQKQYEYKKGSEEKNATEQLVKTLYLKGCIVTLDANGATTKISNSIVDKKADYLIGLKTNQSVLLKYCKKAFDKVEEPSFYRTEEKAHGRTEMREYYQISSIDSLFYGGERIGWRKQRKKWPHLNSFGKVVCHTTRNEKSSVNTRYYFSSIGENVYEFARACRSHWSIENRVNWVLDVVFREDLCRVRIRHAAQNLATIRRMVLNLLRKDTTMNKSLRRKRLHCLWNSDLMLNMLTKTAAVAN